MIRMIRMTAVKHTVTVPLMPLDGLYTVRGRDGQCPSTTRMLYGRNCIRLRWTARYRESDRDVCKRCFGQNMK